MRPRWYLLNLAVIALVLGNVPAFGQARQATPDDFVGAWKLVSIETVRPNGEVIYPFYGKHPQGLIMYDRSGWMSVQIVSDPAVTVPGGASWDAVLAAPAAEKTKAYESYYAYCGTWTLDPAAKTVTHHIRQSLRPGERDDDAVRHFELDGDRLVLTARTHEMGEDHERKLVWQRLSSQPGTVK
jgi:Lipocalin-like domain